MKWSRLKKTLGNWFKNRRDRLRRLLREVSGKSERVSGKSERVSEELSGKVERVSEELSGKVERVSTEFNVI